MAQEATMPRGDDLVGVGWLSASDLSATANDYFGEAANQAMEGVKALKNAPENPMALIEKSVANGTLPETRVDEVLQQVMRQAQSPNVETATRAEEYLNNYYGAKAAAQEARLSFSTSAKLLGYGALAFEGAQAVKNSVVIGGYAAEESHGTMGTPDTNGKALVRDVTTAIDNATETGAVSEDDLNNIYMSAIVSQIFGAEAPIDPDSHSPIATADLAGRYGDDIRQREYDSNHTEEKEMQEAKASRREARERAKSIRSEALNIPSVEEQKSYVREY